MIFPELAQQFMHETITAMRAGDISAGLNKGLEKLVNGLELNRAMIWQVVGDQLSITHEVSSNGEKSACSKFSSMDSTYIVLSILGRAPDGATVTAWALDETARENGWRPYIEAFEGISSHLIGEIRFEIFSGFLALQSANNRDWTSNEKKTVERIAEFLSIIFTRNHDLHKAISDAKVFRIMGQISDLFRLGKDSVFDVSLKSVEAIANVGGFQRYRLYLSDGDKFINEKTNQSLDMNDLEDSFVRVCKVRRGIQYLPGQQDLPELFEGTGGFILPIEVDGNFHGVFAVWQPGEDHYFHLQDREILLTLALKLAECIGAKQ